MGKGWTPQMVDRAKNMQLPQIIRCSACHESKPQTEFSETQLSRLRNKVATQGQPFLSRHDTRCRNCVGVPISTKITCVQCRKEKELESYTKAQRKDTERATCKACAGDNQMSKPYSEEPGYEDENMVDMLDDTLSSVVESNANGVNLQLQNTPSLYSSIAKPSLSNDLEDNDSVAGGIWLEAPSTVTHANTKTASSTRGATSYSGWNLEGFGQIENNPRSRLPADAPRKNAWAKVRSHDPYRAARIMKMSDPTTNEQTPGVEENESSRTISGIADNSKVHKKIKGETKGACQLFD